jgi:hypothetical protein
MYVSLGLRHVLPVAINQPCQLIVVEFGVEFAGVDDHLVLPEELSEGVGVGVGEPVEEVAALASQCANLRGGRGTKRSLGS